MLTITPTAQRPSPTTNTADMALRITCAERRIEALAVAVLMLLERAETPAEQRVAVLARAELDQVSLPHG